MTTTRSKLTETHPTVIVGANGLEANGLEANGDYQLPQDVILVLQDGTGRLLGLNRGQFYGLNIVGTKMLMLLLQQGIEAAVQQIAQDYQVSETQVQTDVAMFLKNLQHQRLITPQQSTSHKALIPSHFTVFLLLTLAWFSIRVLGWTKTIQLWRRWHCFEQPLIAVDQAALI
ncbi:MAG TPA: PqqD family protein, partial [Allocoleopsis sp.]